MHVRLLVDILREAGVPERRDHDSLGGRAGSCRGRGAAGGAAGGGLLAAHGDAAGAAVSDADHVREHPGGGGLRQGGHACRARALVRGRGRPTEAGRHAAPLRHRSRDEERQGHPQQPDHALGEGRSVSVEGAAASPGQARSARARRDADVAVLLGVVRQRGLARGRLRFPPGTTCGYFSTTAERPAYGCYPEVRDLDNLGHSFDFLQELGQAGSFRNAQLRVLQHDATPDVPLRTSDFFIERAAAQAGHGEGQELRGVRRLAAGAAWRRKGALGARDPSPRRASGRASVSSARARSREIQEQATRLPRGRRSARHAREGVEERRSATRTARTSTVSSRSKPAWTEQVSESALREGGASARELAGSFLYDLREYTRGDAWMEGRLGTLHGKARDGRGRSRIGWRCGWGSCCACARSWPRSPGGSTSRARDAPRSAPRTRRCSTASR